MSYSLIKELVSLVEVFNLERDQGKSDDLHSFITWLQQRHLADVVQTVEPDWAGKASGRSADGVINTSLVHLYRYAKQHAKEAVVGSDFSTADDLFYLMSLASNGHMTKSTLIKQNVHEKSAGIQIINRLIAGGFVEQSTTEQDKRSRMIHITKKGKSAIQAHLQPMRDASKRVTEPLNHVEKMELIRLLLKLEDFHENNV